MMGRDIPFHTAGESTRPKSRRRVLVPEPRGIPESRERVGRFTAECLPPCPDMGPL